MRISLLVWRCALVLALGGFGLVLAVLLTTTRLGERRALRAGLCEACRRNHRWQRVAVAAVAALVLVGAGERIYHEAAGTPVPRCGTDWFLHGEMSEPRSGQDLAGAWQQTRDIVTAPVTGLTYGYAKARGMALCTTGPITIAFLPSDQGRSGTTVGHIFLAHGQFGLGGFGSEQLGLHESRHVDQWTALTLAAGPLALPVLYTVDEIFFPGSRNHFEREAGLDEGGYDHPAGFGPRPTWAGVVVIAVLVMLVAFRRLRWLSRVVGAGPAGGRRAEPGRCAVHSRGWFRVH